MKIIKIDKYRDNQKLIRDCIEQNEKAQKYLFEKFSGLFLAISNRYISDEQEAEDIMMESFMTIFTKIESFNRRGSLEGWMKRILVNNCISHLRKQKNFIVSLESTKIEIEADNNENLSNEKAIVLMQALKSLPAGYRSVFNLYVLEDYKHKEIAEILNISESTSKSQLFKARNYIKAELKKYAYEDFESWTDNELTNNLNISHG